MIYYIYKNILWNVKTCFKAITFIDIDIYIYKCNNVLYKIKI